MYTYTYSIIICSISLGIVYPGSHRTLRSIIAPLRIVPQVVKHSLQLNALYVRIQKNKEISPVMQPLRYMKFYRDKIFSAVNLTTVFDWFKS